MTKHTVSLLPTLRCSEISISDSGATFSWLRGFLSRRLDLKLKLVRTIDYKRVNSLTVDRVCEHIARVEKALERSNIRDPSRIFNVDESRTALKSLCRQTLRQIVGRAERQFYPTEISTKGSLDRVTIKIVVSTAEKAYRPATVCPGKKTRYRFVNCNAQTPRKCPSECYIYQREIAGVDSAIFFDCAILLPRLTKELRKGEKYMLLMYDGYKCHAQLIVLRLFKKSRVVVIGLPTHIPSIVALRCLVVFKSEVHFTAELSYCCTCEDGFEFL